jgi:hypothetical protein
MRPDCQPSDDSANIAAGRRLIRLGVALQEPNHDVLPTPETDFGIAPDSRHSRSGDAIVKNQCYSLALFLHRRMGRYAIHLHDADGLIGEGRTEEFRSDDEAIDHVGAIVHPHAMSVWRGDHLVAYFPPEGLSDAD